MFALQLNMITRYIKNNPLLNALELNCFLFYFLLCNFPLWPLGIWEHVLNVCLLVMKPLWSLNALFIGKH